MRDTLKTILLLIVLLTDSGGFSNLRKNQKKLKKSLTHVAISLYDQV